MLTRRAALMGGAMLAAAPLVIKTADAQEVAALASAEPIDLSALPVAK